MPRKIKLEGPLQQMSPKIEKRVYLRAGKLTGDTSDLPSLAVAANEGLDLWCFLMERGWERVAQQLPKHYAAISEDLQHVIKRTFDRFAEEMREMEDAQKATVKVIDRHGSQAKRGKAS